MLFISYVSHLKRLKAANKVSFSYKLLPNGLVINGSYKLDGNYLGLGRF
jgi:hypothetical protein